MPVYEYRCNVCGENMEAQQSFTEPTLTELPGCGEHPSSNHQLKKVFSAVGIAFKGGGFYKNDTRSKTKTTNASSTPKKPAKSEKTTTSTSTKSSD